MSKLPRSGVRKLLRRNPSIFPLQDGVTYLDGWGYECLVLGRTRDHPELVYTAQGLWYSRADGRHFRAIGLGDPCASDIMQRAKGVEPCGTTSSLRTGTANTRE
jgi:hypothetical protein